MTASLPPTMHAVLFGPGERVEVVERPVPERQHGGVLLKVQACGICGSDLHALRSVEEPLPFWLGHEITGEVVEVDPGAAFQPGVRVVVEPLVYCGRCRYCESGNAIHCPHLHIVGIDLPGGYAEYLHLPSPRGLHRLPPDLPWDQAVLVEPLAVAVHALRLAGLTFGMSVAIIGGGTIGQLAMQAARAMGARRTGLLAKYEHQAAIAVQLGATTVARSTDEDALERLVDALGGEVDIVLEAVGGQSNALEQALALVRPLGTVVVTGVFTGLVPFNAQALMFKEARVLGSFGYGAAIDQRHDYALAIDLLEAGEVDGAAMITHRFPLNQAPAAFTAALDKRSGAIKAVLLSSLLGPFPG